MLAGWKGWKGCFQPGYHSNPRVGSGSTSLSACTCVESRTRPRRTRTPTQRIWLALSFIVYVADWIGSVTSVTRRLLCVGSGFFLCVGSGCVARVSSFSDALALSRAPLIPGRAYAHRVRDGDVGLAPVLSSSLPQKCTNSVFSTLSDFTRLSSHPRQGWRENSSRPEVTPPHRVGR